MKEALQMIGTVKQNRELIPLARDIIAEVASNQSIYAAISSSTILDPSPQNTARDLDEAYIVGDLEILNPVAAIDEAVNFTLTFTNIGKEAAVVVKLEELVPEGFQLVEKSRAISEDFSFARSEKIDAGSSNTYQFSMRTGANGQFTWNPSLVYADGKRNYKITSAQTGMVAIEVKGIPTIPQLTAKKELFEAELKRVDTAEESEKYYCLREQVSKIDESIARMKREYEQLTLRLEDVRTDLRAIESIQDLSQSVEDKKKLQNEERILKELLERRQRIFQ